MKIFKKILIANRGEIAVRIIKSAKALGISTVAIYSEADKKSLHVKMADEAYKIGNQELSDTYLNIEKIVSIAKNCNADALHPGYGFLAENAELVAACNRENITFIGPTSESMHLMGNKIEARQFVRKLGIPMTEGATGTTEEIVEKSKKIPLPLLVKAAAGGGGKGMRIVRDFDLLKQTIEATAREAKAYFGDGEVYVEQYIEEPRHIEIQVIGDKHGNTIHLYERECSIQRRYQKIVEESPSPTLNQDVREKMGKSAAEIARGIGYDSAGTIEFLVDKNLNFYFLEMNTRIQVEHPVTEMVTGIDIVREQILVAAGNQLSFNQSDVRQKGHAIEARIYAENPAKDFLPSPGKMNLYLEPKGENIRIDAGIDYACVVESFYDPMISKLVVWGENREAARQKLIFALKNYIIHGIHTNIAYLLELTQNKAFITNNISTKFCDEHSSEILNNIENQNNCRNKNTFISAFLCFDFHKRKNTSDINNLWNQIGFWRLIPIIKIEIDNAIIPVELIKSDTINYVFKIGDKSIKLELIEISAYHLKAQIDGVLEHYYFSQDTEGVHHVSNNGNNLFISRCDEMVNEEIYTPSDLKAGGDNINSPMPGKVIKINVVKGQQVKKGDVVMIVEAMKMENNLEAHRDAIIEDVNVIENEMIDSSKVLIKFVKNDEKNKNL